VYIDPQRIGHTIDVGVGNFSFYCVTFAKLGYFSAAVEPLPVKTLQRACKKYHVQLFESVLSEVDGTVTLYLGTFQGDKNLNLSSLQPNWWGASSEKREVKSLSLATLVKLINPSLISCFKMDVEGAEETIIQQFTQLNPSLLPGVIMFEYGGGDIRENAKAGWSSQYLDSTMRCLEVLKQLGYGLSIVIDAAQGTTERIYDLQTSSITPEDFFPSEASYGNIITLRGKTFPNKAIEQICEPFRDNDAVPPTISLENETILYSILKRLKRILRP